MWTINFYKKFSKNILLYINSRLSNIRSVHTYVIPRTVYFGWICTFLWLSFAYQALQATPSIRNLLNYLYPQILSEIANLQRYTMQWCKTVVAVACTIALKGWKGLFMLGPRYPEKDWNREKNAWVWLSYFLIRYTPRVTQMLKWKYCMCVLAIKCGFSNLNM